MRGPRQPKYVVVRSFRQPGGLAATAAIALGLFAGPTRAALPAAALDDWVEARSEHFRVYSNHGEHTAEQAARHLERLAEVLAQTTQGLGDGGLEVRVFEFRDRKSFKPFSASEDADDPFAFLGQTAGFRVAGPDVELIAYYRPDDGSPARVLTHEYLHVVLSRSLGGLPVWLDEGLAEFYSTFVAGPRSADIGRPIESHLQLLRKQGLMPLVALLAIDRDSYEYRAGPHRGTFYAQSWALVHMLAFADRGAGSRFSALITAFRDGLTSERALSTTYGPNAVDSLAAALETYTGNLSLSYSKWKFTREASDVLVRVRELGSGESRRLLGELAARSRREHAPLAREILLSAWAEDSSSAVEAALLSELAESEADHAEAQRWCNAVERAPRADPRARGIAGHGLALQPLRRGYAPSWPARGADSTSLRARRLLDDALAAEPGRTEWLVPYGLTFLEDSSDLSPGVNALFAARAQEPWRVDVTGGLAILQLRVGNRAGALTLYRQLRPTGEGGPWRLWVGYLLAARTLDDAERWFREGRVAEAESLLVRLPREVHFPGLSSSVADLLAWMRDGRRKGAPPERTLASRREQAADPREGTGPHDGGGSGTPVTSSTSGENAASDPAATAPEPAPKPGSTDIPVEFPGTVPGAPAPGDPRIARVLAAARRGEFDRAEQMVAEIQRSATRGQSARLDSLAAEIRNQRRMQVAATLASSGRYAEACALWTAILGDRPKPAVREHVQRQFAKYCRPAR